MRRASTVISILLVLASIGMAAVLKFRKGPSPRDDKPASTQGSIPALAPIPGLPVDAKEGEPGKFLLLTITPTGFDPSQVTLAAGQYLVLVESRTGLDTFGVVANRERGERLFNDRLERFQRRWKKTIDFKPGRYFIREADHPEWKCLLTITDH
jgi:hypothetical protein